MIRVRVPQSRYISSRAIRWFRLLAIQAGLERESNPGFCRQSLVRQCRRISEIVVRKSNGSKTAQPEYTACGTYFGLNFFGQRFVG